MHVWSGRVHVHAKVAAWFGQDARESGWLGSWVINRVVVSLSLFLCVCIYIDTRDRYSSPRVMDHRSVTRTSPMGDRYPLGLHDSDPISRLLEGLSGLDELVVWVSWTSAAR